MSQFNVSSISSSSVALRLLTEVATRSADDLAAGRQKPVDRIKAILGPGKTGSSAMPGPFSSPDGTKIVLSLAAAEKLYGSDSFLMQTARGFADTVHITSSVIPADKGAFRTEVLAFLGNGSMTQDPEFLAALRKGKVTVNTVDEVPELNIPPMISFTMYLNGNMMGGGGFSPQNVDMSLYSELESQRGQAIGSIGNSMFYAHWPKAA